MLLNLVGSSNADDKEILWKFINRFHQEIKPKDYPILDGLTKFAINYFKDKVEPNKKFKKPSLDEKKALENLVSKLSEIKQNLKPEEKNYTSTISPSRNNDGATQPSPLQVLRQNRMLQRHHRLLLLISWQRLPHVEGVLRTAIIT